MDKVDDKVIQTSSGLKPYLSPLNVWALSFGCAVGWGAFVMPGTTFLPVAGPLGTAIGMAIGGIVMLIIGFNYHYMMNYYPDAGGTYTYSKRVFGYDHGFMSAWFLLLVYIAITWANATALSLISRRLFGGIFQFGFHYTIAGFDVYFGEALLSLVALWLFGAICIRGGKVAARVQTIAAVILFGGVSIGFGAVLYEHGLSIFDVHPQFVPGVNPVSSVIAIVVLAPWAFAGFESSKALRSRPKKLSPYSVALSSRVLCLTFSSAFSPSLPSRAFIPIGINTFTTSAIFRVPPLIRHSSPSTFLWAIPVCSS